MSTAQKVVNGIVYKSEELSTFPEIGSLYILNEYESVRIVRYGHYLIVYTFIKEIIEIIVILHDRMKIESYLCQQK